MNKENRIRARQLLVETAQHYNSNNRSVSPDDECIYGGVCAYIPTPEIESEGCAIGRKLTIEEKELVLENRLNTEGVSEIMRKFKPVNLVGFSLSFLEALQDLHDNLGYWCEEGLNERGKGRFKRMIKEFDL